MNKKEIIDLRFCILLYKKGDPILIDAIKLIRKAFIYDKLFFGVTIPKFNVMLVYSRKEFNRLWGQEANDYMVSFANRKGFVIFSPSIIEKESCWNKSEFYSTLVHEISHLFFKQITNHYVPIWLNEGLATYLQNHKKEPTGNVFVRYEELIKKYDKKQPLNYDAYYCFVAYLLREYKKTKIMMLLNLIKKRGNSNKLFSVVYNQDLMELVDGSNES